MESSFDLIVNFQELKYIDITLILSAGLTHSLVVEDNVRQPDVCGGHVQHVHPAILLRLPHKLVVIPEITLKSAPEKNVKFPGSDIEFSLTGEDLINIQKASAVYSLPDLTFYSEKGSDVIKLILRDKENDTSNTYDLSVKGSATGTFSLDLKIENIRVLPSDYVVKVSQHLISEWTSQDADLKYYIALEPK